MKKQNSTTKPLLSIVVTGHGTGIGVDSFLQSLADQRRYGPAPHSRDPKIICPFAKVTEWGEECPQIELILSWDGPLIPDFNYTSPIQGVQFITNPKTGGCGHHTRQPGIDAATGSWIYLTNCDNMVVHGWLDFIYPAMLDSRVGGIMWDCVNNLWSWTTLGGSTIERGFVDLSCAMFRSRYVKKVGFPFTEYDGDYNYIEHCAEEVIKSGKIVRKYDATLCIHN